MKKTKKKLDFFYVSFPKYLDSTILFLKKTKIFMETLLYPKKATEKQSQYIMPCTLDCGLLVDSMQIINSNEQYIVCLYSLSALTACSIHKRFIPNLHFCLVQTIACLDFEAKIIIDTINLMLNVKDQAKTKHIYLTT